MRTLMALVAVAIAVALPRAASADSIRIVDTGPSGSTPTSVSDWNLAWVAGGFSAPASTITTVEGWGVPRGDARFGGPMRISLLSGGSDVPGAVLFSTLTSVSGVGAPGWFGHSGLSWTVKPGDYWLSFEALSNQPSGPAFSGASIGMGGTPRARLQHEAVALLGSDCNFRDRNCWTWQPQDVGLGMRIQADVSSPTPEPGSLLLLAIGAVGCIRAYVRSQTASS